MHAIYGHVKGFYTNNKLSQYMHLLANDVSTQVHKIPFIKVNDYIL